MRRGFTLIELLVSIALGAVICGTVFAAVRMASQAVATGSRLSVENSLLRGGVYAALDELDSWKSYDDPNGAKPLRTAGNPFCPLDLDEDFNFEALPMRDPTQSYEEWWRRDSRAWWRGDPTSEDNSVGMKKLGDFALYGTITTTDGAPLGGAERRWYHKLVHRTSTDLGYYALLDLAPPCLMATYFETAVDPNNWASNAAGVVPPEFFNANWGGTGSIGTSWWDDRPHDFVALTLGGFYTVADPAKATNPAHQIAALNRAMFITFKADGGNAPNPGWTADDAYTSVPGRMPLLPLEPAHWPQLQVLVRHYAANARQFHAASVLAQSPITGQQFKLRFSTAATTLRGARRARGLDSWPGGSP